MTKYIKLSKRKYHHTCTLCLLLCKTDIRRAKTKSSKYTKRKASLIQAKREFRDTMLHRASNGMLHSLCDMLVLS